MGDSYFSQWPLVVELIRVPEMSCVSCKFMLLQIDVVVVVVFMKTIQTTRLKFSQKMSLLKYFKESDQSKGNKYIV